MPDRRHANGLVVVSQLVDNPVRPNTQRTQSAQAPSQRVSGQGLPPELSQSVLDGVDHRPAQLEEVLARAPRKDDARH
jgi:hypothetical protein